MAGKSRITKEDITTLKKVAASPGGQKAISGFIQAISYSPDADLEKLSQPLDQPISYVGDFIEKVRKDKTAYRVNAKLFEYNPSNKKHQFKRVTETSKFMERIEAEENREGSSRLLEQDFEVGDATGGITASSRAGHDFIQLLGGPFSKQLYWYDYLQMQALAFEARNHNPLAKFIVNTLTNFTLGRGLSVYCEDDKGQEVLDKFWKDNEIPKRLRIMSDELTIYGEIMTRRFVLGKEVRIRAIDPSTVWEIVTEPDDLEKIYYYHQQYPTRYLLHLGSGSQKSLTGPDKVSEYIIRQIPGPEIWHLKINAVSNEIRGRSDLFATLGWLKRLKDYLTFKVIKAKNESAFVWDVLIKGSDADIKTYLNKPYVDPEAGSERVHNESVTVTPMSKQTTASRGDDTAEWLISMIAIGAGIPTEYFGLMSKAGQGSRAGAVVASEPIAKMIQNRQLVFEEYILKMCDFVLFTAGIQGSPKVELTFPEIIVSDRSKKIDDLIKIQGMDWVSKETLATIAAKEMGITSYDFNDEQNKIKDEKALSQDQPENWFSPTGKGPGVGVGSGNGGGPAASAPGRGEDMTGAGKNAIKDQSKTL